MLQEVTDLFGFDKTLWTIKDILLLLNEHPNFIPSQQLAQQLGYSSSHILKLCNQLKFYIQECYPNQELQLIVNKRHGIQLVIYSNQNISKLLYFIFSKDLALAVYQELFAKQVISTDEFCQKNFVSLSTLQRKIKRMNETITTYGLHICFSQHNFHISGKETTIRTFIFFLHLASDRQFPAFESLADPPNLMTRCKDIIHYLTLSFREPQFRVFQLLVTVFEERKQSANSLSLQLEFAYSRLFDFPEKPKFLADWSTEEWQFFLILAFCMDLISFNISTDNSEYPGTELHLVMQDWLQSFEKVFIKPTFAQQKFLHNSLVKVLLFYQFLVIDNALLSLFLSYNLDQFNRNYPVFSYRFNEFWALFSKKQPQWADNYFKMKSFLLCEYFFPVSLCLPEIRIYVYSDLTFLSLQRMKNNLLLYFSNKYKLVLVESKEQADIVIGPIDLRGKELLEHQQFVMTSLQLTKKDLTHIEKVIHGVLVNKNIL